MNRKLTYSAMITAFAVILSYVESIIPLNTGIPGVKLGLANFAILFALYYIGAKEAVIINLVRILIVGFMFGNVISIAFSITGAMISFIIMWLLKKTNLFSVISVSVAGGVSHNIGQMLIAVFIVDNYTVLYYIPVLIVSGIITGAVIGVLVKLLDKRIGKILSSEEL